MSSTDRNGTEETNGDNACEKASYPRPVRQPIVAKCWKGDMMPQRGDSANDGQREAKRGVYVD